MKCARCGHPLGASQAGRAEDRPGYCCLGCVLRARVPVDADGNFPVNRPLGIALAIGFLAFNQLLCWGMGALARGKGRLPLATEFYRGQVVSAVLVVVAIVVCQLTARTQRGKEWVFAAVAIALLARAFADPLSGGTLIAVSTAILLTWSGRGIFRTSARE